MNSVLLTVGTLIMFFHVAFYLYLDKKNGYSLNYSDYHFEMLAIILISIAFFKVNAMSLVIVVVLFITLGNTIRIINWLVKSNNKNFSCISLYLIESFFIIIILYANLYRNFSSLLSKEDLEVVDAIYYSITTFTTTGYGDISPVHSITKLIAASEMLIGYFYSATVMAIIVSKFLEVKQKKRTI